MKSILIQFAARQHSLSLGDKRYAVFAQHQRGEFPPDAIRIVKGFFGGPALATDMFFSVENSGGFEIEDIRVLRISTAHHGAEVLGDFTPVGAGPMLPPISTSRLLLAFGTPFMSSRVDYEPAHIHAATVPLVCRYFGPWIGQPGMHTATILDRGQRTLALDGMSGGAIFSVDGSSGSYVARLRGIILRGGNSHLQFLDSQSIAGVLQQAEAA